MDKRTFKRIKMLHEEGMGMKGAIVVIIDLCKNSEEAAEKITELFEMKKEANTYDRGFCDGVRESNFNVDTDILHLIHDRKERRNYDPPK